MVKTKDALGRFGEGLAAAHLQAAGMQVIERNWRCTAGELDIVARDGPGLVFCEVKTRRTAYFGEPIYAVTPDKARRIYRLARAWMAERGVYADDLRYDVVGVIVPRDGPPVVDHVRAAF